MRGRGGFEHFTDGKQVHVTESVRLKERGEKSVDFLDRFWQGSRCGFGTECMVAIFDVSDLDVV